ncbi:hypothetical protein RRG08_061590 [Elysia crispata]|uniref:Uncharacterized protein n=1 Tax=Elysia crispata TaxID=231223 RepID=A0AAE0YT26_9GAST|nr:hypothetical protein RRG08_061590 [Elysia crispata]
MRGKQSAAVKSSLKPFHVAARWRFSSGGSPNRSSSSPSDCVLCKTIGPPPLPSPTRATVVELVLLVAHGWTISRKTFFYCNIEANFRGRPRTIIKFIKFCIKQSGQYLGVWTSAWGAANSQQQRQTLAQISIVSV